MNIVLSIAGSDPSGGAGIQQDMRAIEACGCYAATVITALTTQNTMGVKSVMPVPADVVKSQLETVLEDLDVKAIKIGQIPSAEVARTIVTVLAPLREKDARRAGKGLPFIILDPVMISTSGHPLMSQDAMEVVVRELFPYTSLITPNLPEFAALSNLDYFEPSKYNILVKGGHAEGAEMCDCLYLADGSKIEYKTEKIESSNLHGTGCALSSAIAAFLAHGYSIEQAVECGKRYVTEAIRGGMDLGVGHGNGPVFFTGKVRYL